MGYDINDWISSAIASVKLSPVDKQQNTITESQTSLTTNVLFKGLNTTPTRIGFNSDGTGNGWTNYFSSDGFFRVGTDTRYIEYNPTTDMTTMTGNLSLDNFKSLADGADATSGGLYNTTAYNYMATSDSDYVNDSRSYCTLGVSRNAGHRSWKIYDGGAMDTLARFESNTNGVYCRALHGSPFFNNIVPRYYSAPSDNTIRTGDVFYSNGNKYISRLLYVNTFLYSEHNNLSDTNYWIKLNKDYTVSYTTDNNITLSKGIVVEISTTNNRNGIKGKNQHRYCYIGSRTSTTNLRYENFENTTEWLDILSLFDDGSYTDLYSIFAQGSFTNSIKANCTYDTAITAVGGYCGIRVSSTYGYAMQIDSTTDSFTTVSLPTWSMYTKGAVNLDNKSNLWIHNGTKWNNIVTTDSSLNQVVKATKYTINLTKANQQTKIKFNLNLSGADDPTFKLYNASNTQRGNTFMLINAGSTNEVNGVVELEILSNGTLVNCVYSYRKNTTWYHETQNYFIAYNDITQISFDIVGSATYTTASYAKITNN